MGSFWKKPLVNWRFWKQQMTMWSAGIYVRENRESERSHADSSRALLYGEKSSGNKQLSPWMPLIWRCCHFVILTELEQWIPQTCGRTAKTVILRRLTWNNYFSSIEEYKVTSVSGWFRRCIFICSIILITKILDLSSVKHLYALGAFVGLKHGSSLKKSSVKEIAEGWAWLRPARTIQLIPWMV